MTAAVPHVQTEGSGDSSLRALREAADWFAVLGAPDVAERDMARWRAWLAEGEANRQAWARVEAISGRFAQLPSADKAAARQVLDTASARQATRRRALGTLALLGGSGLLAWGVARHAPWPAWVAAHRTGTGESRELRLADGARVWLNTASAIDVDFGPALRRVSLHAGEILVRTAPDAAAPPRPFVVDTGEGRLRALGTHFSVRQMAGASLVAVFEGAVEIRPRNAFAGLVVQAGEQTRFTAQGAEAARPAEPASASWARGLLVAEDMRLADFLAELSRYRRGHLVCDPAVADIRIVGTYSLADTDRVLAALAATLPVRLHAPLPWWVEVVPR